MMHSLYQLLIYPIELLLGIVYSLVYETRHDVGLSIIGVSIVVNILLLPLYNRADAISEEERKKQERMALPLSHIKKTFKGDERFMMLQAYYRKMDYHPLNSLRSSLPLLLQIPFFIAAYHFLSNLSLLQNMSFLWIKNLAAPDGIIVFPAIGIDIMPEMIILNGFNINVLPILMTLINIVSTIIYTKGSPLKEKVQLYVMALLFLILLYNSPSGLVIYWTMNNIFSLFKNIVLGIKKKFVKKDCAVFGAKEKKTRISKEWNSLFVFGALLLTLLMGVLIPSSVIVSSPAEFVNVKAYKDPLIYVFNTFLITAGLMLIWIPVFYYLASGKARKVICILLWVGSGISLIDFLVFGKAEGYINANLKYDVEPVITTQKAVFNTVLLTVAAIVMIIIMIKKKNAVKTVYSILITVLVVLSAINIVSTELQLSSMPYLKAEVKPYKGFTLSTHGKNVIVIMLDRGIGAYIPFIMNERPELKEKFSGFVYYPNTISFGGHTMTGGPALFGGYEYSAEGMDSRPDEKLVDKHDEALKVMPVLFSENGYKTTVYDPPLGRYKWVSDLSIYDEYPDIEAYSLKNRFEDPELSDAVELYRDRSFFMYSIYKTVPLICQKFVYDEGHYHYPDERPHVNMEFVDPYLTLRNLDKITEIEDTDRNTFMMMDNEAPHAVTELQLPDYVPVDKLNNRGLETGYRNDEKGNVLEIDEYFIYHVNISPLIQIGNWLDYLKQNGVYDNTRIIIVSDHGYPLEQFDSLIQEDGTDMQAVIPMLLFKDFNAKEYSVSDEFMTNAETPILAMKGLIDDPINPFTGKKIDNKEKKAHDQLVLRVDDNEPDEIKKTFHQPGQVWYRVHENVYDKSNWTRVNYE